MVKRYYCTGINVSDANHCFYGTTPGQVTNNNGLGVYLFSFKTEPRGRLKTTMFDWADLNTSIYEDILNEDHNGAGHVSHPVASVFVRLLLVYCQGSSRSTVVLHFTRSLRYAFNLIFKWERFPNGKREQSFEAKIKFDRPNKRPCRLKESSSQFGFPALSWHRWAPLSIWESEGKISNQTSQHHIFWQEYILQRKCWALGFAYEGYLWVPLRNPAEWTWLTSARRGRKAGQNDRIRGWWQWSRSFTDTHRHTMLATWVAAPWLTHIF